MGRRDGDAPALGRDASDESTLIERARRDPPDEAALRTLFDRHRRALHARCRLLTGDRDLADDLAQETWYRLLRARRSLRPDGHLAGYLAATAVNLWRDRARSERRAGALASRRLVALDAPVPAAVAGEALPLEALLPDPGSLDGEARSQGAIDAERALGRLSPALRAVLVARFVDGESAAEIGRRHGRTEQTITAWIRRASRELRRGSGAALQAQHRQGAERMPAQA